MMRMLFFGCLALAVMAQKRPDEAEIRVKGQLEQVNAIGGESSGWALRLDAPLKVAGKSLRTIEVEYSDPAKLQQMNGKRVSATGRFTRKSGIERGARTVLTISRWEELPDVTGLLGTSWVLTEVAGEAVGNFTKGTLEFPRQGLVTGHGSCNLFSGKVAIQGSSLRVDALRSTRKACPTPVMNQESKYLKALEDAQRFEKRDGILLVHCKGRGKPLRFAKKK